MSESFQSPEAWSLQRGIDSVMNDLMEGTGLKYWYKKEKRVERIGEKKKFPGSLVKIFGISIAVSFYKANSAVRI